MDPLIQVGAFFCAVWCMPSARTYQILFVASVANLILYYFTSESTPWLVVGYSHLDTATCLFLLRFGDRSRAFQCVLLVMAVIAHYLVEIDLSTGSSVFYDSYIPAVVGITVLQMIGAAIDGRNEHAPGIWRLAPDRPKYYYFSHSRSKGG